MVFREACDRHLLWDALLPKELKAQWEKFKGNWPGELKFPRSLTIAQEPVQALDLHAFCDSSRKGTAAVVYAVVYQESGMHQGLLAAKARLAKKGLTMPRLELISALMATNLVDITCKKRYGRIHSEVCVWMDRQYSILGLDRRSRELQTICVQ